VVGSAAAPQTVGADAVVLAVPAAPAARLLASVAPGAAAELAGVEYASMAIVTIAFKPSAFEKPLSGSGFLVPAVEGKLIKAVTFSSLKWGWYPDDVVMLRCSIGRRGEASSLQRGDDELVAGALADLGSMIGVSGTPIDAVVTRWGGALPQYAVGHLERVARIKAAVADVTGLAVCGAAYDGVGIPACVGSGQAAATQVLRGLAREGE
jgi:oxygen-dependent protoporphyrinogen oxidase